MMTSRYAINTHDQKAPYGLPVSLTDSVTGEVKGYFKAIIDAHKARAILDGGDPLLDWPTDQPQPMSAFSTSPTLAW